MGMPGKPAGQARVAQVAQNEQSPQCGPCDTVHRAGGPQPKFFSANSQFTRLLKKVSTNFWRRLR